MILSPLDRYFTSPALLTALAVLPVLGLLALLARRRRRRQLARVGPPLLLGGQVERPAGGWRAGVGWTLGLALLTVGAAGPHWGLGPPPPTAPGRDIVVVLDLSRSMLARDALPNRLGKAKEALQAFADAVQARGGHRLALVAFAARAHVVCPLTHDYDHFRAKLSELDADPPPATVRAEGEAISGTRIGAGLRRAVDLLDPQFRGAQDILLVSDGDDPANDDEWRTGLTAARAAGIPVSTVGIGDPERQSPIPSGEGRLQYQGAVVQTHLHEEPLRLIATRTGGVYLPARTGPPALYVWFREQVAPKPTREAVEGTLPQPVGQQAWFFAAALLLIAGAILRPPSLWSVSRWTGARLYRGINKLLRRSTLFVAALALVSAAASEDWLRRGNDALEQGQLDEALADFAQAAERTTDPGQVAFNQGVALFQAGRFREAELHFRRCLNDATGERRVRGLYNLGCALLQESHGRFAGPLRQAVVCYEQALDAAAADDPLAEDLRTNLELAKRLLAQIRASAPNAADEPPEGQPEQSPQPPPGGFDERGPSPTGREPATGQRSPDGSPQPTGKSEGDNAPKSTSRPPPPGKGNLPPLPDEDVLTPLTPEDTQAYLDRAAERIARERHDRLRRTAPPPSTKFPEW